MAFSEIPDYASRQALEEQLDIVFPAMTGRTVADDLVAVASEHRADAVVVDANLAGGLAGAESLGLPTAVLLHSMYRTYVDTWFGELWPLLAAAVNATRGAFGLADAHDWTSVFVGHDRILSVVPTAFDAPVADVPAAMRHFGFLVPTSPATATVDFPAGDDPTVLVGLSTTYQEQYAVPPAHWTWARYAASVVSSKTTKRMTPTSVRAPVTAATATAHAASIG